MSNPTDLGGAELIVGGVRKPEDVEEIVSAGARIATLTPKVVRRMVFHPNAGGPSRTSTTPGRSLSRRTT